MVAGVTDDQADVEESSATARTFHDANVAGVRRRTRADVAVTVATTDPSRASSYAAAPATGRHLSDTSVVASDVTRSAVGAAIGTDRISPVAACVDMLPARAVLVMMRAVRNLRICGVDRVIVQLHESSDRFPGRMSR